MDSCLGVYVGKNTIKYAKLVKPEGSTSAKAISYGSKVISSDPKQELLNIVEQTGSQGVPVCINSVGEQYINVNVLKQINKADMESLIDLEVYEFVGKEDPNASGRTTRYKYYLADSIKSREHYDVAVAISDEKLIQEYSTLPNVLVQSIYPLPYIIDNLVGDKEQDYLIVSMNEKTELCFVNGRRLKKVEILDVGMEKIMTQLPQILGSYEKAYEACKSTNVFSDENTNNPEVEQIIEPILQDVLNRIQLRIRELNLPVEKIYLTGLVSLFINVDVLFEQYFEIKAEKLRPFFIDANDSSINMAEVSEANEAFSLAYESLVNKKPELDFARANEKTTVLDNIKNMFKAKSTSTNGNVVVGAKSKPVKQVPKKQKIAMDQEIAIGPIKFKQVIPILVYVNVILVVVAIIYSSFSSIYSSQLLNSINDLTAKNSAITADTNLIKADSDMITRNISSYTEFNSYIAEAKRKIDNKEIGEGSTYNVALFMLKISKYIPKGVILTNITSDDAKLVAITAVSKSYAELGYFVSQLKLQGILLNVETQTVIHGETIQVTIGGELP